MNGNIYIGSSENIGKRITQHKVDLKRNEHHSIYLQRAWNKYKGVCFEFELLEFCDVDSLVKREQYYIDKFHPQYNIAIFANSGMRGRKHTKETRNKIKTKLHEIFTKDDFSNRARKMNKLAQLPEAKEKHRLSLIKAFSSEEYRKNARTRSLRLWKTDEHKNKMSEAHKHYSKEILEKFSGIQKKLWKENYDRFSKARRGKGKSKHTKEEIIEIRRLHFEDGLSARKIAETRKDNYHTIRSILYNNWKWIDNNE